MNTGSQSNVVGTTIDQALKLDVELTVRINGTSEEVTELGVVVTSFSIKIHGSKLTHA